MQDRVDPVTEEKESEVKTQDLQQDAAGEEEIQDVLKTDALAEIPADEIPEEDFLSNAVEDETVKEEELLQEETETETEAETVAETGTEAETEAETEAGAETEAAAGSPEEAVSAEDANESTGERKAKDRRRNWRSFRI